MCTKIFPPSTRFGKHVEWKKEPDEILMEAHEQVCRKEDKKFYAFYEF